MSALVALFLFAAPAVAQEAKLTQARGPVSIRGIGRGDFVAARGGEDLAFGDAVKVGKGGLAHILIDGGAVVLVREESILILEGSPERALLDFPLGEFLIGLKKKLTRGRRFQVRTPSAVASVRGTLFWGKVDAAKTTTYAGFGHTVEVTAEGKTALVTPGKTVFIPFGQPPSAPVPSTVTLDYAKNFAIDGGLQGVETLAEKPRR